ncbi:hypothetical protein FM103_18190 [Corynebacterium xerosis]|nr:hypothetical protein FM103_18190 [Corynebacterium xerosis]
MVGSRTMRDDALAYPRRSRIRYNSVSMAYCGVTRGQDTMTGNREILTTPPP